jgi:hypothetical protein
VELDEGSRHPRASRNLAHVMLPTRLTHVAPMSSTKRNGSLVDGVERPASVLLVIALAPKQAGRR